MKEQITVDKDEYNKLINQLTELKKSHINQCHFIENILNKMNLLEAENNKLNQLNENVRRKIAEIVKLERLYR